jgi:hypothetical protein
MLTAIFTKLWLIAIPIWAMIIYILYAIFTDHPDSN